MTKVMLVRHGQASFGSENYDCLSEKGRAQALFLGSFLHSIGESFDSIWSGTMIRHLQTAESFQLGAQSEFDLASFPELNEFDHKHIISRHEPRYENHDVMAEEIARANDPKKAFAAMFTSALMRWCGGLHDHEYNESWRQFQERSKGALDYVVQSVGQSGSHVVITSGGVIAAIVQQILSLNNQAALDLNWNLANVGVTTILVTRSKKVRLISINEHSHFRGNNANLLTWR